MGLSLGSPTSLAARFWTYQKERFPFAAYAPLVAVFTFSAAAYSRLLRGDAGFIPADLYLLGVGTSLVFFFMLRVLDEHKDALTDALYRPELPVPRQLMTLGELRRIGGLAVGAVLLLNAVRAPVLLGPCVLVAAWAALMTREFFVPCWLRAHPTAYLISHMAIMPMIDAYTTGLDWLVAGAHPKAGLGWFLLVTFLNGTLLEVGRKTRAPADEREGVDTYTRAWGLRGAPVVWLGTLAAAAGCVVLAARASGTERATMAALAVLAPVAAVPAGLFLRTPARRAARLLDSASGLWALASYLLLGAGPFLARWLG